MNKSPSFRLNLDEQVELGDALSQLDTFPRALLALGRFPVAYVEAALMQDCPLSLTQWLACAYYGFAPLPVTYRKLCAEIERINRHREDKEEANLLMGDDNTVARENDAAREFELADRRTLKQLYCALDEDAKVFGFDSFEAIINWNPTIGVTANDILSAEREALAAGPLFLYDVVNAARRARLSDLAIGTKSGWILIVHRENDDTANLHAINPAALWHRGFTKREVIKISLASFTGWPPIMPDEVADALERLGRQHFPACELNLVIPQSSAAIEFDLGG